MEQINPIIKADFPDPDVIRVEDTFSREELFYDHMISYIGNLHLMFLTDLKVQMHNAFRESRASMEKGCGQQALDIIRINFMCAFLPMMLEKRICFPQMR